MRCLHIDINRVVSVICQDSIHKIRSELGNDSIKHNEFIAIDEFSHLFQQIRLFTGEILAVKRISVRNSYTSARPWNCFNRMNTREYENIVINCPSGNAELCC